MILSQVKVETYLKLIGGRFTTERKGRFLLPITMPYKVVQTMERGRLRLTAVPDRWERNGILFWPKNKQDKLRRAENCDPDQTWTPINCIVKRSNLRTLKDAENEIDAMSDRSDTETDNERRFQTKRSSQDIITQSESMAKSYNKMAQELVETYEQEASTVAMPQQVTIPTDERYVQADSIIQNQEPKTVTEEISLSTGNINNESFLILNPDNTQMQQIQEDVQAIKQDIKTILNNQNAMFELQSKLLLKYSEFQIQFDEYIKLSSKSPALNQDDAIKIIRNLEDFNDFEKNLTDPKLKEEYQKKLLKLCNKGSGKGSTNAYYLIDHLFEREFLKGCSWTGSSKKDSDGDKICFKGFKNTISFFFETVFESDKTFTKAECEKFFKIILKNARQRCESNKRTSASRQRVKGKRNKIATTSENVTIPEQPVPVEILEVDVEVHQPPRSDAVQPSGSANNAVQPSNSAVDVVQPNN